MPEPNLVCRECGREFFSAKEHEWCSDACARKGWARMHPNVPVRRPGKHRGPA